MSMDRQVMNVWPSCQDLTTTLEPAAGLRLEALHVVAGETYGFIIQYKLPERACVNLGEHVELPWQGVVLPRYRVTASSTVGDVTLSLLGDIPDGETVKADSILADQSRTYEAGMVSFYVEGKIPAAYAGRTESGEGAAVYEVVTIDVYAAQGYSAERFLGRQQVELAVTPSPLRPEPAFFLDLWQHPCSWARVYDVPYFSDDHFRIIENYLRELAALGQKVTDLVVSDFPWAGQACFQVTKNPARLYEYNIVKVMRDTKGRLQLDFTALDRYVALGEALGMAEEIDVFGLIGLWHGRDFGSPLTDYRDPIRVLVYDLQERDGDRPGRTYDFLRTKAELREYIGQLFAHFAAKGWLDRIRVIGDEPGNMENFREFSSFLQSCTPQRLTYKYAIHNQEFLEDYPGSLENFSISTLLAASYCRDGQWTGRLRDAVRGLTWYPCWFPKKLNTFLTSPFVESRLIGVYTYLFRMKGMLRWAYGLYVDDVWRHPEYKSERWPTGDMFLVYPGKNGRPLHSLRERNLFYGLQDFNRFTAMEKTDTTLWYRLRYDLQISKVLALRDGDIEIDPIAIGTYYDVRQKLIEEYEAANRLGLTVAWADTLLSPVYADSLALRKAVFLDELGGSEAVEVAHEDECQYVVLYVNQEIAATGRLYRLPDGAVQLQRIAVAAPCRGLGVGRRLIRELESRAFCEGYEIFAIAARETALPFYQNLGYACQGEPYLRDGVVHYWMTKPSGR